MLRFTRYIIVFFLFILLAGTSCEKEDVEPRTREMEMAELDKKIKALEAKGFDVDTTNMSVFYYVMKKGTGSFPQVGDSCLVSYIGFLPDGSKFEDSKEIYPPDGIWRFKYKPPHNVIGFVNAIGYMNKGAQLEIYVTSDNAYGSKGTPSIPPYTTLIFRAEMHDFFSNQ